jgi:hypothetical protein
MAGVEQKNRIKASSLFETIVALMVIMIVFGIAMTIYVNVMKNSSSLAELKASLRLEEIARETKDGKKYFNESFETEGVQIEKKISVYKGREGIILLEIVAFDPLKKRLADYKEIIPDESK